MNIFILAKAFYSAVVPCVGTLLIFRSLVCLHTQRRKQIKVPKYCVLVGFISFKFSVKGVVVLATKI